MLRSSQSPGWRECDNPTATATYYPQGNGTPITRQIGITAGVGR